jgi:hypothetical protein
MEEPGTTLDGYERRIGRWSRRIAGQFLDWLDLAANRRWLDVGAGTGALSAAISTTVVNTACTARQCLWRPAHSPSRFLPRASTSWCRRCF